MLTCSIYNKLTHEDKNITVINGNDITITDSFLLLLGNKTKLIS